MFNRFMYKTIYVIFFSISTFFLTPLFPTEDKNHADKTCKKFIGDWQCGGKNVTEKIREIDTTNYTVEFDFSGTDFPLSINSNPEQIPFLCKNGTLIVDINSSASLDILSSLSNRIEKNKFMKNPGTYLFDKTHSMKYQTYDIIGKKNILTNCIKLNTQ